MLVSDVMCISSADFIFFCTDCRIMLILQVGIIIVKLFSLEKNYEKMIN